MLEAYALSVAPHFQTLATVSGRLFPLLADGLGSPTTMADSRWAAELNALLGQLEQVGQTLGNAPVAPPALASVDRLVRDAGRDWQDVAQQLRDGVAARDPAAVQHAFAHAQVANARADEITRRVRQLTTR
ncbi:MAG TPA: hypothetical protein VK457_01910 [Chloroflexota bacterium]|nr:hypothetical protein [Chloroflexota bacterium]